MSARNNITDREFRIFVILSLDMKEEDTIHVRLDQSANNNIFKRLKSYNSQTKIITIYLPDLKKEINIILEQLLSLRKHDTNTYQEIFISFI